MSSKEEQASDDEVCAACGKAAVDDVKLKMCTACRLVKYCSVVKDEDRQREMNRAEANDPAAMNQVGAKCQKEGDFEGAIQYLTKAAALGDMNAHYNLSTMYQLGNGVERDMEKAVYHLEEAAIGGHPDARYGLGCHEGENGRYDRAVKHYIIAAKLGQDDALEVVKENFLRGFVSKEDYEAALRGHQAAVDATKSEQREQANQ
jgi:TPR repeat protein